MSATALDGANAALALLTEAMQADGYLMSAAEAGDDIEVTITATEGACPDCLVPKAMFKTLVLQTLQDRGVTLPGELRIIYPPSHHES